MKKTFFLLAAVLFLLPGGCGYRIGSLMHPQIKSIAVAPVVNETVVYNVAGNLRSLLCERFMTDGSLKLLNESKADCILYARVLDVSYSEIGWTSNRIDEDSNFQPEFWQVNVKVEFSVILPGRAAPLISKRTVTGNSWFESNVDLEEARNNGVKQGLFDAAKQIVDATTEAW